jgi:hypothetical protein
MLFPLVYFYLIWHYIKIKIKEQNDFIAKAIVERKVIKSQKIMRSIRSLDGIYSELNQYNRDFWSLYLLSIWLIFGLLLNFTTYFYFFAKLSLIIKLIVGYGLGFIILMFFITLISASSVNYEANKTYKLLNHIMVYNSFYRIQTRNALLNWYSRKIKVKIINQFLIL